MHSDSEYFGEEKLEKAYDAALFARILPYIVPHRGLLFMSVLMVVLISMVTLAIPYLTKTAIDRYIVPVEKIQPLEEGEKVKKRNFSVPLSGEKTRSIVNRNGELFDVGDGEAVIAFEDLGKLDPGDLAFLRKGDLGGILLVSLAVLAVALLEFLLTFLQYLIMEYLGQKIIHDLRVSLFTHIQGLSIAFFNRNPVGRLVTRVTSDVQNMHELFTSVVTFLAKDFFLFFGIMGVLLWMNWKLALISFVTLPAVIFLTAYFAKKTRNVFRIIRVKIAEINSRFSETVGGIKVIQAFGHEADNYHAFKKLNRENYLADLSQIHLFALFMPSVELLGVVTTAVVIYWGGGFVLEDGITLGALVAFIAYLEMFFKPVRDIAEKYNILQNAMASAERIFQILDSGEKLSSDMETVGRMERIRELSLDNVSFSYNPGEKVLKEISLTLSAGKTLAVVGPTGSGKTSLINLIVRFYDPDSGTVRINGRDLREFTQDAVRARIALVMQDPFLFTGTLRENIVHGREDLTDREMDAVIDNADCRGIVSRLPLGLDTPLAEALSSGERQLISIARAFAKDPDLIILDEATSYVDSESERRIQAALAKLLRGRAAVVIAHRLATARSADCIAVLNKGRIIEKGTHRELMEMRGFYYNLTMAKG